VAQNDKLTPDDGFLLIAPLAAYEASSYDFSSALGPGIIDNQSENPTSPPFQVDQLQHWAMEIQDNVYEVTSTSRHAITRKKIYSARHISKEQWWRRIRRRGVAVERRKVAQSFASSEKLQKLGMCLFNSSL
jgi:hypothetical protein